MSSVINKVPRTLSDANKVANSNGSANIFRVKENKTNCPQMTKQFHTAYLVVLGIF